MTFIYLPSDAEIDRQRVERGGLAEFTKRAWPMVVPREYQYNWHLGVVCDALEEVTRGGLRKLYLGVPPGSTKTLLSGVFWQAWEWILNPTQGFIYGTYGKPLALESARKMRDLVRSPWFQERWPHVHIPNENIHSTTMFENDAKGFRFSCGTGGDVTGRHGGRLVGDDLNKAQDALATSASPLELAWDFWSKVFPTRQADPKTTSQTLVGQRISDNDVPGRWMDEDPDVVPIVLPMRYEADHPQVYDLDPRSEGELLSPERYPEGEVKSLETTLGPWVSAGQLQQRPSPRGGRIFQRDWFVHFWKELPDRITRAHSWDHTFGALGKAASWVVGDDWGRCGADYYLVDEWRDRCEFPAMQAAALTFSAKHGGVITKLVEDKADGKAIVQSLRHEIDGLVEWKVSGGTGGKLARAESWTGLAQAGNIWLPHPTEARLYGRPHPCPWVDEWINNICKFAGMKGDVADQVDTASQAITYLRDETGYLGELEAAMARLRKEGRI